MEFQNLLYAVADGIATITVNRPDKLNALNRATVGELERAFQAARADVAVRVVVVTGAGPKAFIAGADINELAKLSPVEALAFSRHGQRVMLQIEQLGKPVIARIQGFALGGGMELAMSCHLRIASEAAKLGQPEINLGIIPGFGGTQRLLRLAGRSAAIELCLLGHPISAERAFQLGAVTRVVPADQLDAEVDRIARQLAASARHAVDGVLSAVLVGGECAIEQGLDYESQAFALCCSSPDKDEGTRAFLEKRKAVFS